MSVVWVNAASYTAISESTLMGTSTATCSGGRVAIGGGFEVHPTTGASDRFEKIKAVSMRPSADGLSWVVIAQSGSGGSQYTFRAVVSCS